MLQPWKVRKVGGNVERAIKECVVLCGVTVACSTASVTAIAVLHTLLTWSSNRGMFRCPLWPGSVQLNKVAWSLHSSYLYLRRWQPLCPRRSIQEVLTLLLCFMEKLLLMTIWSSSWNSYLSSKNFRGLEWCWDLVLDPLLCSAHGAPWQIDHTSYFP